MNFSSFSIDTFIIYCRYYYQLYFILYYMNHNTMDSNRSEPITISSSSASSLSNNEQQSYQSITFRSNDFARYAYLSIFPSTKLEGTLAIDDHLLLLANVPSLY